MIDGTGTSSPRGRRQGRSASAPIAPDHRRVPGSGDGVRRSPRHPSPLHVLYRLNTLSWPPIINGARSTSTRRFYAAAQQGTNQVMPVTPITTDASGTPRMSCGRWLLQRPPTIGAASPQSSWTPVLRVKKRLLRCQRVKLTVRGGSDAPLDLRSRGNAIHNIVIRRARPLPMGGRGKSYPQTAGWSSAATVCSRHRKTMQGHPSN